MEGNTIANYTIRLNYLHVSTESRDCSKFGEPREGAFSDKIHLKRMVDPKGVFLQNRLLLDVLLFFTPWAKLWSSTQLPVQSSSTF